MPKTPCAWPVRGAGPVDRLGSGPAAARSRGLGVRAPRRRRCGRLRRLRASSIIAGRRCLPWFPICITHAKLAVGKFGVLSFRGTGPGVPNNCMSYARHDPGIRSGRIDRRRFDAIRLGVTGSTTAFGAVRSRFESWGRSCETAPLRPFIAPLWRRATDRRPVCVGLGERRAPVFGTSLSRSATDRWPISTGCDHSRRLPRRTA
jgi:hypothetical protein